MKSASRRAAKREFNERVVRMQEACDGTVIRTFYCIFDSNFNHWMSVEPFAGLIWTRDVRCRREFDGRREAEECLQAFRDWASDQDEDYEADHGMASRKETAA